MTNNTGPIIGKHEYGYEVVVQRKRTTKDTASKMDRDALEKKAAEKARQAAAGK